MSYRLSRAVHRHTGKCRSSHLKVMHLGSGTHEEDQMQCGVKILVKGWVCGSRGHRGKGATLVATEHSTANGLDAGSLDAWPRRGPRRWPRRLDASGACFHSTPPLDTSTCARRYSLDVCSTLGSTQARWLDVRAQERELASRYRGAGGGQSENTLR